MRLSFPLAVLASLASCTAPHPSVAAAPEVDPFGLPPVRASLTFPPDTREVTLGWLLGELARSSGQELTLDPALRAALDHDVEPLESTAPVPADEVYPFVEALLLRRAVLLAPAKGGARPVLAVFGGGPRAAGVEEAQPVVLDAADSERLSGHPALYCQLALTFENIDSRQLQTQLRQLLVDASGIQQVVPAGERSLLLQGSGARLLGLARLLREVDRASAQRPRPPAAEPASATGPR